MSTSKYIESSFGPRRLFLVTGLLFLALSMSVASVFAAAPAAGVNPGASGVVVKNYWGHDMTFDIGGTEYTVPADGQLLINLPPGDYTFSSNVQGDDLSDRTGEVIIAAGETLDLGFAATIPMYVAVVETPGQPTNQASQAPAVTTGTGTLPTTPPAAAQPAKTGLLMKNYWGADLALAIGDTQYTVPMDGQLFIALTPGDYTYSASVAGNDLATQNGDVSIVDGHTVTLNSYLNSQYTPFLQ
jgi:hypothetical protein